MAIQQDIEELQRINRDIKAQKRMLVVRRILQIFLVGFLIGKNIRRELSENSIKRKELLKRIADYFGELSLLLNQLEETRKINAFAARMEEKKYVEKLLSLREDLRFLATEEVRKTLLELDKDLANNQTIVKCLASYLENQAQEIELLVEAIESSQTYLIYPEKQRAEKSLSLFGKDLEYFISKNVLTELCHKEQIKAANYCEIISNHNKDFISKRKKEYSSLFNKENIAFDEEQKNAIVTDDKHNLVVAGAGSGKTEVLITRIAYLVKRKPDTVQAKRILAIAYQNKDVKQIVDRLQNRYQISEVEVKTFHKLGKQILQKAGNRVDRNSIVDENKKREAVKALYENRLRQPDFYKLFIQYVKTLKDEEQIPELNTKAETLDYAVRRPYFTINNIKVRSRAEKEIMDFFIMHTLNDTSIDVFYEPDLDGFRPDFMLSKYDLFIEHWALNEKGMVPSWFNQTSEEYKDKMELKKQWFARNNRLLVETFSYEYDETYPEPFIELLKARVIEKLKSNFTGPFDFKPLSYEKLVDIAWGPYKEPIDEIVNFITIAKTYGLSPEVVREKLSRNNWSSKQRAFGKLASVIFEDYENELAETDGVDFEDMINRANSELEKNCHLCSNLYDHILIDEYQDISAQRYKLIKNVLERNPKCKLFCVGDDWQSVMSFSGSNLEFFVNFHKYFENPAVTKISTNYRSIKTIVDAGTQLILKNGSSQISKSTKANRCDEKTIRVLRSPHTNLYQRRYFEQISKDCLRRISSYLENGVPPKEILVLSRFMRTRLHRGYKYHQLIQILHEMAPEIGVDLICDNAKVESKVRVLTVHKSKGLEAKAVFILNVIKDTYGFPCEMEDNSIYVPARENYPKQESIEEERRLFYVAMTRAKEDLIIYTWEHAKSEFLSEIEGYTREERLNY